MNAPDFTVIGTSYIGEKAQQLVEKTALAREIGFQTPPRIVFAEDRFNKFVQSNDLGNTLRTVPADLEHRVRHGLFPDELKAQLQDAIRALDAPVIAVRSSGAGDARGTGIYRSVMCLPEWINGSVKKVLASYFSPDAVAFRKKACAGEGFAIMLEPLVGQWIDNFAFAPVISGFGYTSTARSGAYINAVPGIGGGVETRDGERITREALEEQESQKGNLASYLRYEFLAMTGFAPSKPNRCSALLRTEDGILRRSETFGGVAYLPPTEWHKARFGRARLALGSVKGFSHLNLFPFFDMFEQLERRLGKPQYFELAITLDGQPRYWLIQIADATPNLDMMDFDIAGRVLLEGQSVTGMGVRESKKMVVLNDVDDCFKIANFDNKNEGYILLYPDAVVSGGSGALSYATCRNADVFIEYAAENGAHVLGTPIQHFVGALDTSGKCFAVLDARRGRYWLYTKLDEMGLRRGEEDGLDVYVEDFKVVSSERQNRLVVYTVDNTKTQQTF